MAKWIGEGRAAEERATLESDSESDTNPIANDSEANVAPPGSRASHLARTLAPALKSWKSRTLADLFGGAAKQAQVVPEVYDAEALAMEAFAEAEANRIEDKRPDDGAIDDSGDDYE